MAKLSSLIQVAILLLVLVSYVGLNDACYVPDSRKSIDSLSPHDDIKCILTMKHYLHYYRELIDRCAFSITPCADPKVKPEDVRGAWADYRDQWAKCNPYEPPVPFEPPIDDVTITPLNPQRRRFFNGYA